MVLWYFRCTAALGTITKGHRHAYLAFFLLLPLDWRLLVTAGRKAAEEKTLLCKRVSLIFQTCLPTKLAMRIFLSLMVLAR